jgi:hypothetical protein
MKFRSIDIEDTREGSPYLLITNPIVDLIPIKLFHSIRCEEARRGFRKNYQVYNDTFKRIRWGKNFYVYTLIPFHEKLMLNRLLRGITGDPSFYCDLLDHCDFITMHF